MVEHKDTGHQAMAASRSPVTLSPVLGSLAVKLEVCMTVPPHHDLPLPRCRHGIRLLDRTLPSAARERERERSQRCCSLCFFFAGERREMRGREDSRTTGCSLCFFGGERRERRGQEDSRTKGPELLDIDGSDASQAQNCNKKNPIEIACCTNRSDPQHCIQIF
jgi:hypothetical protein